MPDAIIEAPIYPTLSVADEMRKSYLAYAMSVIVSRALPDVRDGLKPVHRRILFVGSQDYKASGPHKKSARMVGDVMGRLHPHGDSAIYEAMARLAQPFSLGTPLIDGQGNFGSIDGDSPAAMRYTEAKLAQVAHALTDDLAQLRPTRPDMILSYDESEREPMVLPARFPNILVNGGSGIAVGMASNIAPHNLGEVIDATILLLDDPDATLEDLMRVLPGPDFPTGGIIHGTATIRLAYETGRGGIPLSGVFGIEEAKGKQSIVITELPYQVNKKALLEHIADLVKEERIKGVTAIRDESTKTIRVVIDTRRDTDATLVLNQLKRLTTIVTSYPYNAVVLDSAKRPGLMAMPQMLREFIAFRQGIIYDRTEYQLDRARDKLNELIGLYVARARIDEVVAIIRSSADKDQARARLMALEVPTEGAIGDLLRDVEPDDLVPAIFHMSHAQAEAVLRQRLSALTALEREKVAQDVRELVVEIRGFELILNNPDELDGVLRRELEAVKAAHAVPRRTVIEQLAPEELTDDDLIENKALVLTLTRSGYIKTTPLDVYREQNRGGKGRAGMETKVDDTVIKTVVCHARDSLIVFTSRGMAHVLRAYKIGEAAPAARGKPIANYVEMRETEGETITNIIVAPRSDDDASSLVFVTSEGTVRRNAASDFATTRRNGKEAMRLVDENGRAIARLVDVVPCTDANDILIYASNGKAARIPVTEMRPMASRSSTGVAGIKLADGAMALGAVALTHVEATAQERAAYARTDRTLTETDEATGVTTTFTLSDERAWALQASEQFVLTMTARGYGKLFSSHEIRATGRGTQGIEMGKFGPSSGPLVACRVVGLEDGVTLVTHDGQFIRTRAGDIRMTNRTARGVIVFALADGQAVADVAVVREEEEPE